VIILVRSLAICSYGLIFSLEWKEALWDRYVTAAHAIIAAIQRSLTTTVALSRELGINVKTVDDRKTGPTQPGSRVLGADEEAMIVAFRRHTLLPMEDCLYALQPTIPYLTRSSLHRFWMAAWNIATAGDGP